MGILAGLIAALAWTLASSLWRGLSTSLSAIQLNGLKNSIACTVLLPVLVTLPWNGQLWALVLLLISGGLGISLGDSFYLAALRRLGTRRTLTLESLSPVAAAAGGWFAMGEQLSLQGWAGALLVTVSVVLVARQQPPDATRMHDRSHTVQLQGLLLLLPWLRFGVRFPQPRPSTVRWPRVLAATLLGTVLGILLQQVVLQRLPLGIGITVLSTAPVMALLVAPSEGDHLKPSVLLASVLAVTGVGLAVLS